MKQETANRQHSHHFRAMGTDVALWLWNSSEQRAQSALLAAEGFFAQTEARLSRFRADSELSRLNRAAGKPFAASPVLFDLVAEALAWRDRTGGIFEPAVLNALIASGYDRTLSAVKAEDGITGESGVSASVDAGAGFTGAPQGARVDSSGIVLGPGTPDSAASREWASTWAASPRGGRSSRRRTGWACGAHAWWMPAGISPASASRPVSRGWSPLPTRAWKTSMRMRISPSSASAMPPSPLRAGSIAAGARAGEPAHHLIDPRTGAPAVTNIYSVTVQAEPPARRRDPCQDGADTGRRAGAGLSKPTDRRSRAGRNRRRPPLDDRQL